MQTPSERRIQQLPRWKRQLFIRSKLGAKSLDRNMRTTRSNTLAAQAAELVIKPGMKLKWSDTLNKMVWEKEQ